jgi:hypothetical protein
MLGIHGIEVGDLVSGTSMHNYGLTGIVVEYDPNRNEEFKVHWLVGKKYIHSSYYEICERHFDLKKIS